MYKRQLYNRLPYKYLPQLLWKYAAIVSTDSLNYFPVKDGVSKYFSPYTIMKKRHLNYAEHCVAPFGQYVQAYQENDPKNTPVPRTMDGLYLRPTTDRQRGHEILNLATGHVVVRPHVWKMPITESIIKMVDDIAIRQEQKSLKITGRNEQVLSLIHI